MKRPTRKWITRSALAAAVLLILALAGIAAALFGSVPTSSGTYEVEHLGHNVVIHHDAYDRAYVDAKNLKDALFAEGWLHARHRLWQMELFRRAATGRLAELLGSSMLESDKELWRMGVPQLGRELEKNAQDEMRGFVKAYVNGINAAIDAAIVPPPEFLLLRHSPAHWTPSDVYAMGALMVFQSANNSGNELLRLALVEELGSERTTIFLPDDGRLRDFPYVAARTGSNRFTKILRRLEATDPLDTIGLPSFAFGSNGWVVSPQRSATGDALFAFDSHDDFGLPNLFYEVHMFYPNGRQLRGWSVAGLPGIVNGYNERIAWGFTNTGDSQDLFLETRSESDPLQFKDGDSWYRAENETVEIPVSGRAEPESLTIIHTKNGPLISEDPPIALRWTIQDLGGMGIDSILAFNQAQDWEEFTDALDQFAGPPLNATYADVDGNIGFRTAGLLPIRGRGEGLFPLKGDDPAGRWQGLVEMDALPEVLNPRSGFLAAANARVNATNNGPLVSADNAPGYRMRRLQDVLSNKDDFTAEDMQRLQVDWFDGQAALLLPVMLPHVDTTKLTSIELAAFEAVKSWQPDPIAKPELGAPLVFQAWYRALASGIFEPAMSSELYAQLMKKNYVINHALDRLLLREQSNAWWRNECQLIVHTAFRDAVEEIRGTLGDDVATWRLDAMHRVKLEHELGKAVPQLGWFFNLKSAPWGGGPSTLGRARYRYDRAYDATGGATVRVVGQMNNPPDMQAIIPNGQSGHPLSPHYDDQFPHWLAGELLPIAADLSGAIAHIQTLTPAK